MESIKGVKSFKSSFWLGKFGGAVVHGGHCNLRLCFYSIFSDFEGDKFEHSLTKNMDVLLHAQCFSRWVNPTTFNYYFHYLHYHTVVSAAKPGSGHEAQKKKNALYG